jgi:hypothetical protein
MFPRDDTHVIFLTTSNRGLYCLLVIPSGFTPAQGSEALLAAATHGNRHSAGDLLERVTDELPVDPAGFWATQNDDVPRPKTRGFRTNG